MLQGQVQVLSTGWLRVVQQVGQGKDDIML